MDFKGQNIEEWFCGEFGDPKFTKYVADYNNIKTFLLPIHEEIKAVVAKIDPTIYLNAHGLSHINMIINKVSILLSHDEITLSPREVFLLLLSIQLHDIGHVINGRENHAIDAGRIISKIAPTSLNIIEKKVVFKIVAAHSGKKNDPIGQLPITDIISNDKIRNRFLAALVRLADELADGRERASNFLLSINLIPEDSIIYHTFSSCLDSFYPELETHSIRIRFFVSTAQLVKKYKKGESNIYLIDEIYNRTLTTFTECLYYNRFVPESIRISSVEVDITFLSNDITTQDIHEPIKYKLKENGYPTLSVTNGIFDICKKDLLKDNIRIDGEYIYQQIKQTLDNESAKSI